MTRLEDLSPQQQAVVQSWGKSLAILAGAGTGKTTTLVIKCEELMRRNPEARFAAVSFTEKSTSDLRDKLSERLPLRSHWVMTIHGLCNSILREFPKEAGFDGEESMLSEPESQAMWDQAVESLWFDELQDEIRAALDRMLARESRDGLADLLKRTRELKGFGADKSLAQSGDADTQALSVLAQFVLARYERLKRRRGALDFNDLELGADRALEHEPIRRFYHSQFHLVMVDEFQDTNPLQASIIQRFTKPDGSNLCVVGDPKQSIYRFRDADLSVFEEFCSRMQERHSLTWNFRSRPGIIDYTNSLCAKAFASAHVLAPMPYEPLVPKREASSDLAPVIRLDVTSPRQLGAWLKEQVAGGLQLESVALLLRKIRGNEQWLKALSAEGIPIAVGSGGLFWEDPRVRELVSFLNAWDNPANSLSAAIFLRAPWLGVSDQTLDESKGRLLESFFESAHPVALRLAAYRGKTVRPGELLLALLGDELEQELGAPLLGLWHRVEELSSQGLDFHAVVTQLQDSLKKSRRERDVPPPRNRGLLSVLTLHASKGLEFPHVILVDLGKKPRGPDMPLLFWDRDGGAYLAGRDADRERQPKDPKEIIWRMREKEKSLAESKRLFYVALTRARERLILVCPEIPAAKTQPQDFDPYLEDHWRAWVDCESTEASEAPPAQSSAPAPLEINSERSKNVKKLLSVSGLGRRPRHSVTEWNLLTRCPRAYEWTYIRPRLVEQALDQSGSLFESTDTTLSQRELGTRVHSCLEKGDREGLKRLELEVGSDRFQSGELMNWAEHSPFMAPANGRGREIWNELSFEVKVAEEVLVGSIDRVVSDTGLKVIDFKVTQREKSKASLIDAYQTQLELYSYALKKLSGAERVETFLIQITPRTVVEIELVTGKLDIEGLAQSAARIVSGEPGMPKPGELCRFCQFRAACPESLKNGSTQ